MLEPFIIRALLAGLILVAITGPLGCFVVWKRMAYFGDALSHSALLGIALGLAVNIPLQIAILIVCILFAAAIYFLQQYRTISNDTLLGILAHTTLAYGLIGIALLPNNNIDLQGLLFGDILSVQQTDLYFLLVGGGVVLALLIKCWQPLLLTTLNQDMAQAEGFNTRFLHGILLLCLTLTVALAIQVVGVLLVTSLLIIPAAGARFLARGPEIMALAAFVLGALAVVGGISSSVIIDVPTGPSIVAALAIIFFMLALGKQFINLTRHRPNSNFDKQPKTCAHNNCD